MHFQKDFSEYKPIMAREIIKRSSNTIKPYFGTDWKIKLREPLPQFALFYCHTNTMTCHVKQSTKNAELK